MKLNPYVFFDGNCDEAFAFYRSVFGGEYLARMTFSDGPDDLGVDAKYGDQIMHVSLPVGDSTLMGSDMAGRPLAVGSNVALSCHPDSTEDADRIFAALCEGGDSQFPLQKTFWGSYFGTCRDRFGIDWQINTPLDAQKA